MKLQTIKNIMSWNTLAWLFFACAILGLKSFTYTSNATADQAASPITVASHGGDPFELLYFDVLWNGNEVIIMWDAVNELELVGFQIERSEGGGEFKRVGWVYSRELSREVFYEHVDHGITPADGTYFYRLKMVEFDGSITYSPITKALRLLQ